MHVRCLTFCLCFDQVDVAIKPGTHVSEEAGMDPAVSHMKLSPLLTMLALSVNKQLADKERVAAALENKHLLKVINQCLDISPAQH